MKKVSIIALIWAKVQVKLCIGLIYILSPVKKAMYKILSEVLETQYRAKATIGRRSIEQIKPTEFQWSNTGMVAGTTISTPPVMSSFTIGNPIPNNTITFNQNNKPVLVITGDGDVEWHGKPSEAADALETVFQFKVEDMKGVTKAARRRYYYRACKNILNKAEKMEQNQFLDFLKKQVYNKERRIIMDELKGEEQCK